MEGMETAEKTEAILGQRELQKRVSALSGSALTEADRSLRNGRRR